MENRDQLEIPVIKFTPVTLLDGGVSGCGEDPENPDGIGRTITGTGGPGGHDGPVIPVD